MFREDKPIQINSHEIQTLSTLNNRHQRLGAGSFGEVWKVSFNTVHDLLIFLGLTYNRKWPFIRGLVLNICILGLLLITDLPVSSSLMITGVLSLYMVYLSYQWFKPTIFNEDQAQQFLTKLIKYNKSHVIVKKLNDRDKVLRTQEVEMTQAVNQMIRVGDVTASKLMAVDDHDKAMMIFAPEHDKGTLYTFLKENKNQAVPEYLGMDLIHAVLALNQQGIEHCDLKPDNILLVQHKENFAGKDFRRHVKIVDFGVSKTATSPRYVFQGAPSYHPPEARPSLFKYDVYSLGLILNEMYGNQFKKPDDQMTPEMTLFKAIYQNRLWADQSRKTLLELFNEHCSDLTSNQIKAASNIQRYFRDFRVRQAKVRPQGQIRKASENESNDHHEQAMPERLTFKDWYALNVFGFGVCAALLTISLGMNTLYVLQLLNILTFNTVAMSVLNVFGLGLSSIGTLETFGVMAGLSMAILIIGPCLSKMISQCVRSDFVQQIKKPIVQLSQTARCNAEKERLENIGVLNFLVICAAFLGIATILGDMAIDIGIQSTLSDPAILSLIGGMVVTSILVTVICCFKKAQINENIRRLAPQGLNTGDQATRSNALGKSQTTVQAALSCEDHDSQNDRRPTDHQPVGSKST
ncbi:MAG: hypothetical protein CMF51_01340 [Legionellales bacterium]|nr:hypothetical protein [Legionellales bacterium]